MTVGSQVKGCYSSVKSVEASLLTLESKTQDREARECFHEVQSIITEIKTDLEKQVIYLSQQEPQYKN
ncbi:DUF1657 domain-containing protein [Virgibacillus sp. JSM 102003]|uniref:DUF1657 domain-containing protein n=1 Tax=Virgibacillus sp. JSM 102003 TaxID=1562108 RepID=UPI0035C1720F